MFDKQTFMSSAGDNCKRDFRQGEWQMKSEITASIVKSDQMGR